MSGADWREEELTVLNLRIVLRTNEPGLADYLRSVFPPVEDDFAGPVPPGRRQYTVSSLRGEAQQQAYQMKEAGRVVLRPETGTPC